MSDSTVTLTGNLTRDPELRFTQGGKGICNFGIAVNRRYQQNGEWVEKASFLNCSAWGELGENVAASLTKGMRVVVTGRIESSSWQTDSGDKRTTVEVVCDEVGPSLRWATAEVTKTSRREPAMAGGGSAPKDPVYGDEEPF